MPDGTVGVRQPDLPDRLIDNEVVQNDQNQSVYRQKVRVPLLDAVLGTTADAAVTGDTAGTASGKLRGLVKIITAVWNAATNRLKVDVEASVLPPGAATQSSLLDAVARLDTVIAQTTVKELTERMQNKQPAAGYRLWFDTANAAHIYILEALAATTAAQTGFRGIRITKDASGNPLGKVEVNTGATLTFDNRTTDGAWS